MSKSAERKAERKEAIRKKHEEMAGVKQNQKSTHTSKYAEKKRSRNA